MTNEQLLQEIKEYIDGKFLELRRDIETIKTHVMLNSGDAEAIAELQRRFNKEAQKNREMEIENFLKHR